MYQTSQQTSGLCSVCSGCGRCSGGLESIASPAAEYRGSTSSTFSYSSSGNRFSYTAAPVIFSYAGNDFSGSNFGTFRVGREYVSLNPAISYSNSNLIQYQLPQIRPEYTFSPDSFLKPGKAGKFVGQAEEVKEFVEEAFVKMFKASFPDDIKISVLEDKQFRKLAMNQNTIGLSINRRKAGLLSEIFVLNGSLGQVMLTIGHELGHVLTETLGHPHDEEAKAYAFSLMWMSVIKEENIANLREAIILNNPAENGLHNVAFNFVEKLVKSGKLVKEVYLGLIKNTININVESF